MAGIVLLATEHPDKKSAAVRTLGPSVACALTAGEGPSTNPKRVPNEDSLAVVELPTGGHAAFVADSHWGPTIGEACVRTAAYSVKERAPETAPELAIFARELASRARDARAVSDESATTFLAAIVRGSRVIWTSIADSHIYVVGAKGARRLNSDLHLFAGYDLELAAREGMAFIESGELELAPGELLLLASDGIDPEMSGVSIEVVRDLLCSPGPLEARVEALIDRARRAPRGGRDNVALVAIAR